MEDFRQQLTRERKDSGRWGAFDRIRAANYEISIQANENTYCHPRENLDDVSRYAAMEVAIFSAVGRGGWIHPVDIQGLDSKFAAQWEPKEFGTHIGPYINIADIQELYEFLCNCKSDPRGTIEERVTKATEVALDKFWRVVASRFPEMNPCSLTPIMVAHSEAAMLAAVEQWVQLGATTRQETQENG